MVVGKRVRNLFFVFIVGLFLFSLIGFVVGQTGEDPVEVGKRVGAFSQWGFKMFAGFFEGAFGNALFGDLQLMSRILLFILLMMAVYSILDNIDFFKKGFVRFTSSLVIALIAVISIPTGFLDAIETQYGAMGAALLVMIPFLIILYFTIKVDNLLIARLTWGFYAFYNLMLYAYKAFVIYTDKGFANASLIPHLVGFGLGVFVFFGIKPIRRLIFHGETQALEEKVSGGLERQRLRREAADQRERDIAESVVKGAS
ncbi:MAG: hypothetical protein ABIF88_01995 [archaeon]